MFSRSAIDQLARLLTAGKGDGRISKDDVNLLLDLLRPYPAVQAQLAVKHLVKNYSFSEAARTYLLVQSELIPQKEEAHYEVFRTYVESEFYDHVEMVNEAFQRGENYEERVWEAQVIERDEQGLPEAVRESVQYYVNAVEDQDIGSVRLFRHYFLLQNMALVHELPAIDAELPEAEYLDTVHNVRTEVLYTVLTTTDGDDGWVECYTEEGSLVGAGRVYIELIAWDDRMKLREMVQTGEFPAFLEEIKGESIWGK